MNSPKYAKNMGMQHYQFGCEMECPDHSDLLLLRDTAADERNAIALYYEAALSTCLDECFLHVAREEMCHYAKTMRLIACLDPIQAEALCEMGLGMLTSEKLPRKMKSKWECYEKSCNEDQVETAKPITKQELVPVQYLTKALEGEFQAINKYQRYMAEAECEEVMMHFCELMNDEKKHVAEFTACLYNITHEPPRCCKD